MDTLIYGAGAVGLGLGSALLAAGAHVRFVAREATVEALQRHGLLRTGRFGRFHAPPETLSAAPALADLAPGPVDFALVTTKTTATDTAARALAARPEVVGPATQLVLCQNGWGNAERFAAHFPEARVWNARVITGFRRPQAHHVEVTVHAEPIHLGSLFGRDPAPLAPLAEAIDRGGLPCATTGHVGRDLWAKMLYNGCLNPLGAIFGVPYGALGRSPHARGVMEALARETFAVMRASGYDTHWDTPDAWLADFYERLLPPTADHESSTLQDLRAGKRTEIDALTGAVVGLGAAHGVEVPVSRTVLALVRFIEAARATPPAA